MKLVTILAAVLLSGCAGLSVSWVATATYNTQAVTTSVMTPGAK
jgi:LPS O-antigen subunit length determinant protein (WzzB/FepE family)